MLSSGAAFESARCVARRIGGRASLAESHRILANDRHSIESLLHRTARSVNFARRRLPRVACCEGAYADLIMPTGRSSPAILDF